MADQNQFVSSGPFSDYLRPQQSYVSTAPPLTSAGTTKGGAVAMMADQFLQGLSRGRALAYQRSEIQNSQAQQAIKQAILDVQNAPIPDAQKQQESAKLQAMLGQMIYHSIGGDGKSGGKKGGGQAGGDEQHPGVHIGNAIKSIVGNLIGPGAQKSPVDPKEIRGTIQQVYQTIQDPKNSLTSQVNNADQQLWTAYDAVRKQNGDKDPTTSQLMQNPQFFKQYGQSFSLTGKPTPGMRAILSAAQIQDKIQDPEEQARIKEQQAQGGYYAGMTERDQAEAAKATQYTNTNGDTLRLKADGSYFNVTTGKPATPAETKGLHTIGPERAPVRVSTKALADGTIAKIDAQGNMTGLVNDPQTGRPARVDTAYGRLITSQGFIDERTDESQESSINRTYDAQLLRVDSDNSKSPAQKAQMKQDIETRRQRTLGGLRKNASGSGDPTANFLNQIFGGTGTPPPAPNGRAVPSTPPTTGQKDPEADRIMRALQQ